MTTYIIKYIIIGDSNVGKTSLSEYYVENKAAREDERISTIGVEFYPKTVKYGEDFYKIQVWDTAGQERFRSVTNSYYRGSHGCFMCFSICNRDSYKMLTRFIEDWDLHNSGKAKLLLVGTFSDKENERQITYEEANKLAAELGCSYIEVSSKTGHNVNLCFETMNQMVIDSIRDGSFNKKTEKPVFQFENYDDVYDQLDKKNKKCSC